MNDIPTEVKLPPLHEWVIPYLQSIADKHSVRTGNDLELGQAEFRGAIGMLLCHIPKGHMDIRDAVRNFALQLDMIGDEMVEKIDDHLLQEKEKADRKKDEAKSIVLAPSTNPTEVLNLPKGRLGHKTGNFGIEASFSSEDVVAAAQLIINKGDIEEPFVSPAGVIAYAGNNLGWGTGGGYQTL